MSSYLDQFSQAYKQTYNLDNRLILNWYPKRILELHDGKKESILELGLGHGYSACIFSGQFQRHVILDGSAKIIEQFKQQHELLNTEIKECFFEEYDDEEQFDMIVMGFILEHVDDPGLILERYRKYLKPGGSLFIAVPNCQALNKRFGYEAGLLESLWELGDGDRALGHKQLFSVQSLTELAKAKGYRLEATEGLFLKPITTQQMIDLDLSEEILQAMLKVGRDYPELCVGILMKLGIEEGC